MPSVTHEINLQFDYSQLDAETALFLQRKEKNMRNIVGNMYTELGHELYEAQQELAKRGYGCFGEWLESIGFKKSNAYRLIERYEKLILPNWEKRDLLDALPVSLTYEIAKLSADSELKQKVLDGEIKTLKEYKELEKALKEAEQARREAEKRLSETIDQTNQRIRELEGQLEQAKAEVRVKEVVKEVIPQELIEKANSLEQQLKCEREKRRELQTQLEEKEEDLIALTRSQLLEKDRYKIHDLLSEMNSQVGRFIKKVEMEINKLKGDREVTESVLASAKTLRSSADQLEKLLEVKEEKGRVVDAEYTVITQS